MHLSTKNLSLTTALIIISTLLSAQKYTPNLDIHLGANFTRFGNEFENTFNDKSTWKTKIGAGAGVIWIPHEGSGPCFRVGLAYTPYQLDYKIDPSNRYPFLLEENVNVNLLQAPLELGYFKKTYNVNYYITVGLSPSFITKYNGSWVLTDANANLLGFSASSGDDNFSSPIYNKFQLFGLANLGISKLVQPGVRLGLKLTYQRALTRLENRNSEVGFFGPKQNFWKSMGVMEESRKWTYIKYGSNTMVEYDAKLSNTILSAIGIMVSLDIDLRN